MATPLSSLNKRKKLPIARNVAFRMAAGNTDDLPDILPLSPPNIPTSHSLESLFLDMDNGTQAAIVRDVKRVQNKKLGFNPPKLSKMHSVPSLLGEAGDTDLLTSLTKKLRVTERQLIASNKELLSRKEYIRELEGRASYYESAYDRATRPGRLAELESRCSLLQHQLSDMEEFLSDYGLIWVGKEEEELPRAETDTGLGEGPDRVTTSLTMLRSNLSTELSGCVWVPESATPASMGANVDFNLLVGNVKALNLLLGEKAEVVKTNGGARFRRPDTIPLTLYRNGYMLFQGPFRSYTDPSSFQVIQDIQDGCFPQELIGRYPGGLPFDVFDRRDLDYEDPRLKQRFPGVGYTLGGNAVTPSPRPLAGLYEDAMSPLNGVSRKKTSDRPQAPVPIERFLSKLPASVVKKGKVIDIRSEIEAKLNPKPTPIKLICLHSNECVTDPGKQVHLKIRSLDGSELYSLSLSRASTVADVMSILNSSSPAGRENNWVLKSNYPKTATLSDPSRSLDEYQLFPSALLFLATQ